MEPLVKANLLTVGLGRRSEVLEYLPVRLISVNSAAEATRCIRNDSFESIVSRWHLSDISDGTFLRRLRIIKPDVTTIVLVEGDDPSQEIEARSIGVSAVLTEESGDEFLIQTVATALGIEVPAPADVITEIKQKSQRNEDYGKVTK